MRLRDLCWRDACLLSRRRHRACCSASSSLPSIFPAGDAAARSGAALSRNEVDYLPIDELSGRIATTLWVVYPPGIATIVPGERLDERARPMIDYLKVFERGANLFPGFEAEIQGIFREIATDGSVRFYTYVARE